MPQDTWLGMDPAGLLCAWEAGGDKAEETSSVSSLDYSPEPWAQEANWSLLITLYVPHTQQSQPVQNKGSFPKTWTLLFALLVNGTTSGFWVVSQTNLLSI